MMKRRFILMAILIFGICLGLGFTNPVFAQVQTNIQIPVLTSSNDIQSESHSRSDAVGSAVLIQNGARENIQNQPFFPLPVPLIQGGRVGDLTDQLPNFAGMRKLRLPYIKENGERKEVDSGEMVNPEKIASFYGCLFSKIALQDIWIDLVKDYKKMQDKGWDPNKMRYRVYYKDRAKAVGVNLGGSGGASGFNGSEAVQGSGGAIFGYSSSTADPVYIVMICEVTE